MLSVREPEINYQNKPTSLSTERINNQNKNKTNTENISNSTSQIKSNQLKNSTSEANFAKGEFENLFSINSEKQKIEFIKKYKLGIVEDLIDSKLEFPENHLIVVINTKKALLELTGEALSKGAGARVEYDFEQSLFKRMWDVIIKFSQNLKKRNLLLGANKNGKSKSNLNNNNYSNNKENFNNDLNAKKNMDNNNNPEIFECIKIFTLNKSLEYFCTITEPLTAESAEKHYSHLLRKCLSFSAEALECDLSHAFSQLLSAMQSNKNLFPENFKVQKSNFYISDSNLPSKTKFYRVLFFNGATTEQVNLSALENKLIAIKAKFNIVFNYFLFEHDFQFEKKIYPLLLKNNMLDHKNSDFEIFMKKDRFDVQLQDFQSFISNLHQKANLIEKQINEFFAAFADAKNLFFGNPSFREHQKNYDTEHSKLMQDYEIISKNNAKYFEFGKANVNKPQIDYIKKYFAEMLNKNVIGSLLQNVKNELDFPRFNSLLGLMIEEANGVFDSLVRDLNGLLISLKDLGILLMNNYNFFL